jgi:catechol 2,3-dioxygenase-like lactoylglutathione lyase family enzyme
MTDQKPTGGFNALVPEFDVFDLAASKKFWCDTLGFSVAYERPEHGFCYLQEQGAQVMLKQRNGKWETGALERPLGRGINFQIFVKDIEPILNRLRGLNWTLFKDVHDAWYRVGDKTAGSRQFLVQDPDGYLLRFAQDLGERSPA